MGVGIDIVEIARFKKIPYDSNKTFYKKIFTPSEIKYCTKFNEPSKHFASKFAIKEAVQKSISEDVKLLDIVTAHKKSKPVVSIKGNKQYGFVVSVSHEKTHAIAVVLSIKLFAR
jgi:holo-[acyl-carrier protein] synthase